MVETTGGVLSGINFEFYLFNHQFSDDFKLLDLRSPGVTRSWMQSGKPTPDGDKDALSDVAMDELSRTGLSPARARSVAEARRPGKPCTARPLSEWRK